MRYQKCMQAGDEKLLYYKSWPKGVTFVSISYFMLCTEMLHLSRDAKSYVYAGCSTLAREQFNTTIVSFECVLNIQLTRKHFRGRGHICTGTRCDVRATYARRMCDIFAVLCKLFPCCPQAFWQRLQIKEGTRKTKSIASRPFG